MVKRKLDVNKPAEVGVSSSFDAVLDRAGLSTHPDMSLPPEATVVPPFIRIRRAGEPSDWPAWVPADWAEASQSSAAPHRFDAIIPQNIERIEWAYLWDGGPPDSRPRAAKPIRGMLEAFCALGDGPPDAFLDRLLVFLHRWGPFGRFGTPHGVTTGMYWHFRPEDISPEKYAFYPFRGVLGFEPVSIWHWYVDHAKSILRATASLREGKRPSAEDYWSITSGLEGIESTPKDIARISDGYDELSLPYFCSHVGSAVATWTRRAQLEPFVEWRDPFALPTIRMARFGPQTAMCVLGVQILFAIAGISPRESLPLCFNCREVINRTRYRAGYRSFCAKEECKRAGRRMAKQDQRSGLRRWEWSKKNAGTEVNSGEEAG